MITSENNEETDEISGLDEVGLLPPDTASESLNASIYKMMIPGCEKQVTSREHTHDHTCEHKSFISNKEWERTEKLKQNIVKFIWECNQDDDDSSDKL